MPEPDHLGIVEVLCGGYDISTHTHTHTHEYTAHTFTAHA